MINFKNFSFFNLTVLDNKNQIITIYSNTLLFYTIVLFLILLFIYLVYSVVKILKFKKQLTDAMDLTNNQVLNGLIDYKQYSITYKSNLFFIFYYIITANATKPNNYYIMLPILLISVFNILIFNFYSLIDYNSLNIISMIFVSWLRLLPSIVCIIASFSIFLKIYNKINNTTYKNFKSFILFRCLSITFFIFIIINLIFVLFFAAFIIYGNIYNIQQIQIVGFLTEIVEINFIVPKSVLFNYLIELDFNNGIFVKYPYILYNILNNSTNYLQANELYNYYLSSINFEKKLNLIIFFSFKNIKQLIKKTKNISIVVLTTSKMVAKTKVNLQNKVNFIPNNQIDFVFEHLKNLNNSIDWSNDVINFDNICFSSRVQTINYIEFYFNKVFSTCLAIQDIVVLNLNANAVFFIILLILFIFLVSQFVYILNNFMYFCNDNSNKSNVDIKNGQNSDSDQTSTVPIINLQPQLINNKDKEDEDDDKKKQQEIYKPHYKDLIDLTTKRRKNIFDMILASVFGSAIFGSTTGLLAYFYSNVIENRSRLRRTEAEIAQANLRAAEINLESARLNLESSRLNSGNAATNIYNIENNIRINQTINIHVSADEPGTRTTTHQNSPHTNNPTQHSTNLRTSARPVRFSVLNFDKIIKFFFRKK